MPFYEIEKDYAVQMKNENIKPIYALVDTTIFMKGQIENDTLIRKNLVEGLIKKVASHLSANIGYDQDGSW